MPSFKLLPTFWAFNRTSFFIIGTRFSTTTMLQQFKYICKKIRPEFGQSERGYLVRILVSRPGVPGSNPIAVPKSLVGLRDLNQFYHIGTQTTVAGEMITPA